MEALYLLLVIALVVMVVMVIAFVFSVKSGQYDDLEGSAWRILLDDDDPKIPHNSSVKAVENTHKKD